jgi:hypothetical protein
MAFLLPKKGSHATQPTYAIIAKKWEYFLKIAILFHIFPTISFKLFKLSYYCLTAAVLCGFGILPIITPIGTIITYTTSIFYLHL